MTSSTLYRIKLINASTNTEKAPTLNSSDMEIQCEIEPEPEFSLLTQLPPGYQYRSHPDFDLTDICTSYSESDIRQGPFYIHSL